MIENGDYTYLCLPKAHCQCAEQDVKNSQKGDEYI